MMTTTLYAEKERHKGYFNLPPSKRTENNLLKKEDKSLAQVIIDKIRSEAKDDSNKKK